MGSKSNQIILTVTMPFMMIICIIWIYPFLWMVSASLKGSLDIFQEGLQLIPDTAHWENYARAWQTAQFSIYLKNTIIITLGTLFIVVLRCSLAGYVLGRYDFIGKRTVLAVLIATFLVPVGNTIIPITQLSMRLNLLNTRTGVILALGGGGQVAAILLYMGFFRRIPKSLSEAAVIDGAGFFTVFRRIMLPMAGPVTATVSILTFMSAWNNFMIPLVFTFARPELRTLAVGVLAFQGTRETDWSGMAAAGSISLLPVISVFLLLQRYFVTGISGAVKG